MTIAADPVTRTWMCDAGLHGRCKGKVLSIATGDHPQTEQLPQCECDCHS